jgi:hypothetical protein
MCLLQHLPVLLVQVLLLKQGAAHVAGFLPHSCCVHGTACMLAACYQPIIHVQHPQLAHGRVTAS